MKQTVLLSTLVFLATSIGLMAQDISAAETSKEARYPYEKQVLVEMITAESCTYCPLKKAMIEKAITELDESYQNRVHLAALHRNDAIAEQWASAGAMASSLFSNFNLSGTPAAMVDRSEKSSGNTSIESVSQMKERILAAFGDGSAPAKIEVGLVKVWRL